MPEVPIAMVSFDSRLYVWGKNKLYKVDPFNLHIEDEYEGVSIIGKTSFVKTEFGLCFLDKNNIYLHNGNKPMPIGNSILESVANVNSYSGNSYTSLDTGYKELIKTTLANNDVPTVKYLGPQNSFAILLSDTNKNGRLFTYSIDKKRWDLSESPRPYGAASGKMQHC